MYSAVFAKRSSVLFAQCFELKPEEMSFQSLLYLLENYFNCVPQSMVDLYTGETLRNTTETEDPYNGGFILLIS